MTPAQIKQISQDTGLNWRQLADLCNVNESTIRKAAMGSLALRGPCCMVLDMIHNGDLPERFNPVAPG